MKTMMWKGVVGCVLALCLGTARADAALSLNGVSDFVELRRSFYLAALFLERPGSDAEVILASDQPKQMVIKVTADRWSPMRFSSQWSRALIINNDAAELERHGDAVIEFNNLLQDDLVYGDELVITRARDGSTRVELNGEEAFSVARPGFTEVLLRTWIGPRPPSSDFRQQLLGQSRDAELVSRYWGLAPAEEREELVSYWRSGAPSEPERPAAAVAAATASTAAVPTVATPAPLPESSATVVRAARTPVQPEDLEPEVAEAPAADEPPAAATATVERPVLLEPVESVAQRLDPVEPPLTERPGSMTVAAAVPEVFDDAEPLQVERRLSAEEEDALVQLYQNLVVRKILANVEYPGIALRRNLQGMVQLRVTVDRSGQILGIEDMDITRHAVLNDAARDAVMRTDSFPRVPAALPGDRIEVQVPIRFRLQ